MAAEPAFLGKELCGSVYANPPSDRVKPLTDDREISREELAVLCATLPAGPSKPVLVEHDPNKQVGVITAMFQAPQSGTTYARFKLYDTPEGRQTHQQIASNLNEQQFVPLKGSKFTSTSVRHLLANCDELKHLTPRRYLEMILERMSRDHEKHHPDEEFRRPGFPRLAKILQESGYLTPKGHGHWWPAQVQQLLAGRFDQYYDKSQKLN